jgi:hypothetical protein
MNAENVSVTTPLLSALTEALLQAEDDYTREKACQCVAAVVNRIPTGVCCLYDLFFVYSKDT